MKQSIAWQEEGRGTGPGVEGGGRLTLLSKTTLAKVEGGGGASPGRAEELGGAEGVGGRGEQY